MESKLLQTLRYRLQNRMRRLNSTEWQLYHWQLCQFWGFLKSYEIFSELLRQLDRKSEAFKNNNLEFKQDIEGLVENTLLPREYITFETEEKNIYAGYLIVKYCVEYGLLETNSQREIRIGTRYSIGGVLARPSMRPFRETFLIV